MSASSFARIAVVLLAVFSRSVLGQSIPSLPPLPVGGVSEKVPAIQPIPVVQAATGAVDKKVRSVNAGMIDLSFVRVPDAVDLIFSEGLKSPHVIGPDVLADQREVSIRFVTKDRDDLRQAVADFLHSLGYSLLTRGDVDYVEKLKPAGADGPNSVFVYEPRYRDADYLSRLVQPMFSGRFTENRQIAAGVDQKVARDVPAGSAASLIDQRSDKLIFVGSTREVVQLKDLLPQLDTPVGSVSVRAWVYEVTDTSANNSAFQLAMSILGGRVGAALNVGSIGDSDNAIRLSVGGLSAALSALNSDSRFKVLTSPNLRVRSGDTASLNVGESVPVIGSVSYPSASGSPVQSVEYRDAGVIFQVQPVVKRDAIDLHLVEEISSFVNTTTGVNNSPTKNTRKLESSFTLSDGDVLLIGGLMQDQDLHANSGLSFLPRWMAGHRVSSERTEILLLLQVQKI